MITERLKEMLVRQIASELQAHTHYMAISIYFRQKSLDRWGKLFHKQAVEEAGHATKIIDFLVDNGVEFDLPGAAMQPTRFDNPLEACRSALASEQRVSQQFQDMATAASEERDFRTFQFLQWFIEEQVEEESKIQKLIDLVESGVNLFQAEGELDRFDSD